MQQRGRAGPGGQQRKGLSTDDWKAEENAKLAAQYSPDISDREQHGAYFYEAWLLTGNPDDVGLEWPYVDYLMRKGKKAEALFVAARKTVLEPTNTNCGKLQILYREIGHNRPFPEFWLETINGMCKVTPSISVKFTDGKIVAFGTPNGVWTYIDIWGTWCSPCRAELPEVEKAYQENLARSGRQLAICTFSYESKKLKDFMITNKYSFPVAEIDPSLRLLVLMVILRRF